MTDDDSDLDFEIGVGFMFPWWLTMIILAIIVCVWLHHAIS